MKRLKAIALTLMCLLAGAGVGMGIASFRPTTAPIVVYAEGEETSETTFEQKTYVYEDDYGKATLILLSETEFSMTVGEETKYGTYVRNGNVLTLTLGESSIDVEINDILGTFGEPKEEPVDPESEKKTNELLEILNNFVIPAVSGLLGVIGFSGLVAIIFGIIKLVSNAKEKASRKEDMSIIKIDVSKSVVNSENAEKIIKEAGQSIIDIKNDIITCNNELKKDNADIKDNTDLIPILYNSLIILCKLMALYMAADENAVAKGIAEQANIILEELEKIKN